MGYASFWLVLLTLGTGEPSRHVVCYAGGAKVFEGDTDPAGPYYVGTGNRITFVDRRTHQLISTTVACITLAPWPVR